MKRYLVGEGYSLNHEGVTYAPGDEVKLDDHDFVRLSPLVSLTALADEPVVDDPPQQPSAVLGVPVVDEVVADETSPSAETISSDEPVDDGTKAPAETPRFAGSRRSGSES